MWVTLLNGGAAKDVIRKLIKKLLEKSFFFKSVIRGFLLSNKTEFGWYKNAGNANWTFICILLEIYILTTSKQASLSPTTALAVCQVSLAATHGGSSSYKMGEISPIATHSLSGQECLQGLTHGSSSPSSWTSSSSSSSPYSSPSARWSRIW